MIVETDKGPVQGTVVDGVHVFKGVPYAAPPVEALRWRPPEPAAAWVTPAREAYGPACTQPVFDSLEGSDPVGDMDEDCLFLNVWTTAGTESAVLKPVMVWIHGGAFKVGSGSDSMYDGGPLARMGAVVVTFNYRLGLLGFFAHPALDAESDDPVSSVPVNFGLLDQIAALEWVRDNIAGFGGDPDNVTIFGQSAGAMSVLALFASQKARGLFHKGIAQSPYAIPERSREQALALGQTVARDLFEIDNTEVTAADLRQVDAKVFSEKTLPGTTTMVPSLAPSPVRGDCVLPGGIRAAFEEGTQAAVPLIVGSNSDEASVLEAFGMEPGKVMELIIEAGGEEAATALALLKSLYQGDPELSAGELNDPDRFASLVLRDMLFTAQVRWIADQQARLAKTRRYYFSYLPELLPPPPPLRGVAHGGEIVFPFGTGNTAGPTKGRFTENDQAMSDKVTSYWFTFAKDDNPVGGEKTKEWTAHTVKPPAVLPVDRTLKLGADIEVQINFRKLRLDALIAQYPKLEEALDAGLGSIRPLPSKSNV